MQTILGNAYGIYVSYIYRNVCSKLRVSKNVKIVVSAENLPFGSPLINYGKIYTYFGYYITNLVNIKQSINVFH